jgi:hypothetical protein
MENLTIEQLFTVDIEDYHNYNFKKNISNYIDETTIKDRKNFFNLRYIDNILPNELIKKIYNFCNDGLWKINHGSSKKGTKETKVYFFSLNVYNNIYFKELFYKLILPVLDISNKENIIIDRAYVNGHQYGNPGHFHRDGRTSTKNSGPTIMVYINYYWEPTWNGGTKFMIELENDKKEYLTIDFVPGRIVVFDPHISHCALDTSIYTKNEGITRMTLAYHTIYKNNC